MNVEKTLTKAVGAMIFLILTCTSSLSAQQTQPVTLTDLLPNSLLQDRNGDGRLDIVAFGDSITRGVGDFIAPHEEVEVIEHPTQEAGYPLRIEALLHINVFNLGEPGETLTEGGMERFAVEVPRKRPDIVIIGGGSNDARARVDAKVYFHRLQTLINIAQTLGITPVLFSPPPTCCGHGGQNFFVVRYNEQLIRLGAFNSVSLADSYHAFSNTCEIPSCVLLNLPEGLHPNIDGYDVLGEVVISSLLGINLYAPEGAATLESALVLPPGSVMTKPDPAPAATTG